MRTKLLLGAALFAVSVASTHGVCAERCSMPSLYMASDAEEGTGNEELTPLQQAAKTILETIGENASEYSELKIALGGTEDELRTACLDALKANEETTFSGITLEVESYDFTEGNMDGWYGTKPNFSDGILEVYNGNIDFWRERKELPNGWYEVQMDGFYRGVDRHQFALHEAGLEPNYAVLFGDDVRSGGNYRYGLPLKSVYDVDCSDISSVAGATGDDLDTGNGDAKYPCTAAQAKDCLGDGRYHNTVNVYVTDGGVVYGIAGPVWDNRWLAFTNIKLVYKGNDKGALQDAMEEQAKSNASNINSAYVTKVNGDIEAIGDQDIEKLNSVVMEYQKLFNAIVECRLNANTYKGRLATLKSFADVDAGNESEYLEQLTAWEETVTSVAEVDDVNVSFETGYQDLGVFSSSLVGVDMTDSIKDALCEDETNEYWLRQGSAEGYVETPLDENKAISYWNGTAQDGFLIYQDVTDLPAGVYKVKAISFGRTNFNESGYGDGLYICANGVKTEVNSNNWTTVEVNNVIVGTDGKLTLGLYGEGNTNRWGFLRDVELTFKGANLTLDESNSSMDLHESLSEYAYPKVIVRRTFNSNTANWNTFCVPFAMTEGEVAASGIKEVRKLSGCTKTDDAVTLIFSEATEIEAGVPYIVKVGENAGVMTVENKEVTSDLNPVKIEAEEITMTGNYGKTVVPFGAYFINSNTFYYADRSDVNLKGFRAYITLPNSDVAGVNRMLIDIDGVTTAVKEVLGDELGEESKLVDVYTLSGVKVKHAVRKADALEGLPQSIYIVDGKKVVK